MKSFLLAGAAGVMLLAGCQKNEAGPSYLDIPPSSADTISTQTMVNYARLANTSNPVRSAFLHDFPNAGVSNIQTLNSVTGQVLYQITFIQNGEADSVIYDDTGLMIRRPAKFTPLPWDVTMPEQP